jgi:hypothetical protein
MTSSDRPQLPDSHRLHDRLLVARAVGDDLDRLDRAAADALLEACADCRVLAAELRTLRSTAASLPAARRPRDFRLTEAQAERLRGGTLRRLLAPLGGPVFGFLQPLAGAVIAIGLGLLVVTSLPTLGGSGAAQFAPQAGQPAAASQGSAEGLQPVPGAGQPITRPGQTPISDTFGGFHASPSRAPVTATDKGAGASDGRVSAQGEPRESSGTLAARDQFEQPAATDWRFVGLALALLGLVLLIGRGYARRYAEDPLLR